MLRPCRTAGAFAFSAGVRYYLNSQQASMRKLILALAMVLACERSSVADVVGVTSNVLKRVVRIVIGKASGTAFTLEVDGRHYLITAKHVVATLKDGDSTIKVCGDGGQCVDTPVTVLRCADPTDIAVLVPSKILTATFNLPATSAGMVLGQDVYFVASLTPIRPSTRLRPHWKISALCERLFGLPSSARIMR